MKQIKTALRTATRLLAAGVLACASLGAQATVITLGGTTVNYTFDDSLLGLFGPASISGDTLSFSPTAFSAQSLNGAGIDFQSQTINILATPKSGWTFSSLNYMEQGHYSLEGASLVDAGGQVRIFDPTNPPAELTPAIAPDAPFVNPADNLPWQATVLEGLGGFAGAASLNITIENLLGALSMADVSTAQIGKEQAQLTITTQSVPEGNSLITLLVGLGVMGLHLSVFRSKRELQKVAL